MLPTKRWVRLPSEDDDEVLLYVPLCYKAYFGSNSIDMGGKPSISIGGKNFTVVGIKYYIDNTKQGVAVMTEIAYKTLSKYVSEHWKEFRNLRDSINVIAGFNAIEDLVQGQDNVYNQASLFFKSDRAAKKAVEKLRKQGGYIACSSKETYNPDILSIIERIMTGGFSFVVWVVSILFIVFFVNLCSHRALDVIKNDLTIYRSMGISVKTIKISMFFRMIISIIPGILVTAIGLLVIYLVPNYNDMIRFLHWYEYLFTIIGILIITIMVTRKQIRRLFEESVKKTLKGGADA